MRSRCDLCGLPDVASAPNHAAWCPGNGVYLNITDIMLSSTGDGTITPHFIKSGRRKKKLSQTQKRIARMMRADPTCFYCRVTVQIFDGTYRHDTATLDHIVPRSKGGGGGNNLALCCKYCNQHKMQMTELDWRTHQKFEARLRRLYGTHIPVMVLHGVAARRAFNTRRSQ